MLELGMVWPCQARRLGLAAKWSRSGSGRNERGLDEGTQRARGWWLDATRATKTKEW